MARTILVLNGPNLNLLGSREPEIYGRETLDELAAMMTDHAATLGLELDIRQSNHEGHLIDWLHEAQATGAAAVILNAGGYSHTSVALHDAIKSISTPVIAVHISDPATREPFRQADLVALAATQVIKGQGTAGYMSALDAAALL